MDRIAFVILHYKVAEVTDKCIELLHKQQYTDYKIIVVDNYSANGSLEILEEKYLGDDRMRFIPLEKNYGFAKANDIGYLLAKHKYDSDFIVVMNNDVMIYDENFCKKLVDLKLNENTGVIGPDIVNLKEEHQNPLKGCITTKKELKKTIRTVKLKIKLIPMLYNVVQRNKKVTEDFTFITERKNNVPLHGACLIFTRHFIDKFEYAFYPDTFLYGEEELLFYLGRKANLDFLYEPYLKVQHMEDVSTDSVSKNQKDKRMFQLKNSLKSLEIFNSIIE